MPKYCGFLKEIVSKTKKSKSKGMVVVNHKMTQYTFINPDNMLFSPFVDIDNMIYNTDGRIYCLYSMLKYTRVHTLHKSSLEMSVRMIYKYDRFNKDI